jgi:hypothetical protein
MLIDLVKPIITQTLIYWILIRRFGTVPVSIEFNSKWDDDIIFAGGVELSLLRFCRKKV